MALRDKIRTNALPFLHEGEELQVGFACQTLSGWFALISYWIIVFTGYRVVLATDRRIIVCRAGRLSMTRIKEVLREMPRTTPIGPPQGLWYRCDSLGERLYIHRRFHGDVRRADELAGLSS